MKKLKIHLALLALVGAISSTSAFACEIPQVKGFEGIDCLYEGYARVLTKGKWNYIDRQGQKLSDVDFDYAWEFHEDMAAVEVKNKWGFINKSGELVIPLQYDYVWDFQDDKALVNLDGRVFYVNKAGVTVD